MSETRRSVERPDKSEKIVYPRGVSGFFITDDEADKLHNAFMPFYEKSVDEAIATQRYVKNHVARELAGTATLEETLRFAMFGYQEQSDLRPLRMMCERFHDVLIQIGIRHLLLTPEDVSAIQQMRSAFDVDGNPTMNSFDLQKSMTKWQDAIVRLSSSLLPGATAETYNKVSSGVIPTIRTVEEKMLQFAANTNDEDRFEKLVTLLEKTAEEASFAKERDLSGGELLKEWAQKDPRGATSLGVRGVDLKKYVEQPFQRLPEGISVSTSKYKNSRGKVLHTDFINGYLQQIAKISQQQQQQQQQVPMHRFQDSAFPIDPNDANAVLNANARKARAEAMAGAEKNAKEYLSKMIENGDFSSMDRVLEQVVCQSQPGDLMDLPSKTPSNQKVFKKDVSEILKKLYEEYVADKKETRLRGIADLLGAALQLSSVSQPAIRQALQTAGLPEGVLSVFDYIGDKFNIPREPLKQLFQIMGLAPDVATWLGGAVLDGAITTIHEMSSFAAFTRKFSVTHYTRPSVRMDIMQARESARRDFEMVTALQTTEAVAKTTQEVIAKRAAAISDEEMRKEYIRVSSVSFPDDMYPSMVMENFSTGSIREPHNVKKMSISEAMSYVAASLPTFPAALDYLKKIIPTHEAKKEEELGVLIQNTIAKTPVKQMLTEIAKKRHNKKGLDQFIDAVKEYFSKRIVAESQAIVALKTNLAAKTNERTQAITGVSANDQLELQYQAERKQAYDDAKKAAADAALVYENAKDAADRKTRAYNEALTAYNAADANSKAKAKDILLAAEKASTAANATMEQELFIKQMRETVATRQEVWNSLNETLKLTKRAEETLVKESERDVKTKEDAYDRWAEARARSIAEEAAKAAEDAAAASANSSSSSWSMWDYVPGRRAVETGAVGSGVVATGLEILSYFALPAVTTGLGLAIVGYAGYKAGEYIYYVNTAPGGNDEVIVVDASGKNVTVGQKSDIPPSAEIYALSTAKIIEIQRGVNDADEAVKSAEESLITANTLLEQALETARTARSTLTTTEAEKEQVNQLVKDAQAIVTQASAAKEVAEKNASFMAKQAEKAASDYEQLKKSYEDNTQVSEYAQKIQKLTQTKQTVETNIEALQESQKNLENKLELTKRLVTELDTLKKRIEESKGDDNRADIVLRFQREFGDKFDSAVPAAEESRILLQAFISKRQQFNSLEPNIFTTILQNDIPQDITGEEYKDISRILAETRELNQDETEKIYAMAERVRVLQSRLRIASAFPALYTPKTHRLFNDILEAMTKAPDQRGDMANFFLPADYPFDMISKKTTSKEFEQLYNEIVDQLSEDELLKFQLTETHLKTLLAQEQLKSAMSNVVYRERVQSNVNIVEYLRLNNSQPAVHYEKTKAEIREEGPVRGIDASIQAFLQLERMVEGNTQYLSVYSRPVVDIFKKRHEQGQGINLRDCVQALSYMSGPWNMLNDRYGKLFQGENQSDADYNDTFQDVLRTVDVQTYQEITRGAENSRKEQIERVREIQSAASQLKRMSDDFSAELQLQFPDANLTTNDAAFVWATYVPATKTFTRKLDWKADLLAAAEGFVPKQSELEPLAKVSVLTHEQLEELYKAAERRIPSIAQRMKISEMSHAIKYITDASYRSAVSPSKDKLTSDTPTRQEKDRQAATLSGLLTSYLSMFNTYAIIARGVWGLTDVIGAEITSLADLSAETLRYRILALAYEVKCSERVETVLGQDENLLNSAWEKRKKWRKAYYIGSGLIFYLNKVYYDSTAIKAGINWERIKRSAISTMLSQAGPAAVSGYVAYTAAQVATSVAEASGLVNPLAISAVQLIGAAGSAAATFYAAQFGVRKAVTLTIAMGGLFWFGWGVLSFNTLAELTLPSEFYLKTAAWGIRTGAQLIGSRTARRWATATFEKTFDLFFGCMNPLYVKPETLYARMLTSNATAAGKAEWKEDLRDQALQRGVYSSRRNFVVLLMKNIFGASASGFGNYAATTSMDTALRFVNDNVSHANYYTSLAIRETLNAQLNYNGSHSQLFDTMLMSARHLDDSLQSMGIRYLTGISLETTFLSAATMNFYSNFIVSFVTTMFTEDATSRALGIEGQSFVIRQEVERLEKAVKKRKELKEKYKGDPALDVLVKQEEKKIREIEEDLEKRKQLLKKLDPSLTKTKQFSSLTVSALAVFSALLATKVAISDKSYSSWRTQLIGAFSDLINDNTMGAIITAGGFMFLTKLVGTFRAWSDSNREGKMGKVVRALATVGIAMCSVLMANSLALSTASVFEGAQVGQFIGEPLKKIITTFSSPKDALEGILLTLGKFTPSSQQFDEIIKTTRATVQETLQSLQPGAKALSKSTLNRAWAILSTAQSTASFTNALGFLLAFLKNVGEFVIPDETPEQMKAREERALDTLVGFEKDRQENQIAFEIFGARNPIRSKSDVLLDSEINALIKSYPPTFSYDGLLSKFKEVLSCKLAFPKNMDRVLKLRQELISTNFANAANLATFSRVLYLSILIRHPDTKKFVIAAANPITEPIRHGESMITQAEKTRIVQDIARPLWIHFYAFVFEYARVLKFYTQT